MTKYEMPVYIPGHTHTHLNVVKYKIGFIVVVVTINYVTYMVICMYTHVQLCKQVFETYNIYYIVCL